MDKITKAIKKLSEKEREVVKFILLKLKGGETKYLDVKKLKGREDIFRIRKGNIRVIYRIDDGIYILAVERRKENTYNYYRGKNEKSFFILTKRHNFKLCL